ncbi:MAG TPA: prepilin peptidase [Acidobacteriaceae bacterium]|nr:prepilin peptidase [Acidobacteriaceae bacterium]
MIPAIVCVLSGLAFGSFLNVCITRLPLQESVAAPRSHCRDCGRTLTVRENIPLVSWILLHGRCKDCKIPISWRYPAVELATCVLFCMCFFTFGWNWRSAAWSAFCFLLLGLAVMDGETMLLPDRFTVPGLALGVIVAGVGGAESRSRTGSAIQAGLSAAGTAAASALAAAGVLLAIGGIYWLVRRRQGMGMGDVKLIAMLAAWLGLPRTALALFFATVAGAIYGVLLLASRKKEGNAPGAQPIAIPFGAFLSIAGLYSVFLGEWMLRWYLHFFS